MKPEVFLEISFSKWRIDERLTFFKEAFLFHCYRQSSIKHLIIFYWRHQLQYSKKLINMTNDWKMYVKTKIYMCGKVRVRKSLMRKSLVRKCLVRKSLCGKVRSPSSMIPWARSTAPPVVITILSASYFVLPDFARWLRTRTYRHHVWK